MGLVSRVLLRRRLPYTAAVLVGAGLVTAPGATATPPTTFDPIAEAQNFSITQQRQAIYDTPQYQAQLAADGAASTAQALAAEAADPGRFFTDDVCWNLSNGCAGDIRLNTWTANGYGISRPVLFTARDGCPGMVPTAGDGWPGDYSYVKIDTTPDARRGTAAALSRR